MMSHPKCFHFSTPIAMRILNSVKKNALFDSCHFVHIISQNGLPYLILCVQEKGPTPQKALCDSQWQKPQRGLEWWSPAALELLPLSGNVEMLGCKIVFIILPIFSIGTSYEMSISFHLPSRHLWPRWDYQAQQVCSRHKPEWKTFICTISTTCKKL